MRDDEMTVNTKLARKLAEKPVKILERIQARTPVRTQMTKALVAMMVMMVMMMMMRLSKLFEQKRLVILSARGRTPGRAKVQSADLLVCLSRCIEGPRKVHAVMSWLKLNCPTEFLLYPPADASP